MTGAGEAAQDPFGDGRLSAPSALRNRDAIAMALAQIAPAQGRALEIASGTGEHVIMFAAAMPELSWHPSDPAPDRRASIAAWATLTGLPNIAPPLDLDACIPGWASRTGPHDLVFAANLLHLVTDAQARACLAEMARALAPGGRAAIYGPFLRDGRTTSPGDAAFHASLQATMPGPDGARIGYKDVAMVHATWAAAGLRPDPPRPMPANNLLLSARKPSAAP